MNVFLDLDGTLINNSKRYFESYRKASNNQDLNFESFLISRKKYMNAKTMFTDTNQYTDQTLKDFEIVWGLNIEKEELLSFDTLFSGVPKWLHHLSKKTNIIYCTNRRSYQHLINQLEYLDIKKYASDILMSFQKTKEETILKSNIIYSSGDWFIGDTPADISAGKSLGLKTCGVFSGLNSEQVLKSYNPDLLLSNVTEFIIQT